MRKGSDKKMNLFLSKYGHGTELSLEEEYVELFQPKEQPIQYNRFTDPSE